MVTDRTYRDPVTPAEREAFLRTHRPAHPRPAMSKQAQRTRGLLKQLPPTDNERKVIDAIRLRAVRRWGLRAAEIADVTGQSEQGAASVAASAVRKGLARRFKHRGHVRFALTDKGWRLAKPRQQQWREGQ